MSESLYDVDVVFEVTISVSAKNIEEAKSKVDNLSDEEIVTFIHEQLPYMGDNEQSRLAH